MQYPEQSPAAGICHIHCYRSSPYSLRRTMLRSYPITHLLPGIFEISQEAIAQQMNERIAMTGIAAQTGINGWAALPATKTFAIGPRKNMCIRYIPNDSFDRPVTMAGASFLVMQVNNRKAPNDARRTFGVQNAQDHSSSGV